MKKHVFLFSMLLACMPAMRAQLVLTSGTPATETFTGFTGSGFKPAPGAGQLDSDNWSIYGHSQAAPLDNFLAFGDTSTVGDLARGTASTWVTSAGIYAFNQASGNTWFWVQPTAADFTPAYITLRVNNQSGNTINAVQFSYDWMVGNDGNRDITLEAFYSVGDTLNFMPVPNSQYTSVVTRDSMYYNGTVNETINGISLANGQDIFFRWVSNEGLNGTGSRDEFGIDNISVMDASTSNGYISFIGSNDVLPENGGTLTVQLLQTPPTACTVDVAVIGGTAGALDYNSFAFPQIVLFDGQSNFGTFDITALNDATVEANETVIFELQNPSPGCDAATGTFTVTIMDDDVINPATASFDVLTDVAVEGGIIPTLSVTVNQTMATACTVTANVIGGTATNGADYDITGGQLSFVFNGTSTSTSVPFSIIDDASIEAPETILLQLSSTDPYCDVTTDTLTITIISDDMLPLYNIGTVTTENANGVADSLGVHCRLQGVVVGPNYRGQGLNFVVNDTTGGIWVFKNNANFGYTPVTEGDEVEVWGTIAQFNGLTQLNLDTVIFLNGTGAFFSGDAVTALDESTEAELVTLQGVFLVDPAQWNPTSPSGFNIQVTNQVDTFTVRIDNDIDLYGIPATTILPMLECGFDVTGLGGQFDSSNPYDTGYQLLPRNMYDLVQNYLYIDTGAEPIDTVDEADGSVVVFSLMLENPRSLDDNFTLYTGGTATVGTDYTINPAQVTIPAYSSVVVDVTVNIVDDASIEGAETIEIWAGSTFTCDSLLQLTSADPIVVTIIDNDSLVNVTPAQALGLEIAPNPGKDFINISANTTVKSIAVINSLGQTVLRKEEFGTQLSVSELATGIYTLEVTTTTGTARVQWAKQ